MLSLLGPVYMEVGGLQVGEVTRLAVVEKWPAFTCKLTTPGSRGDVTRRCCVVARHVNRENGGRTTHFGGQCSFPLGSLRKSVLRRGRQPEENVFAC